jgi:hypothetical protein
MGTALRMTESGVANLADALEGGAFPGIIYW